MGIDIDKSNSFYDRLNKMYWESRKTGQQGQNSTFEAKYSMLEKGLSTKLSMSLVVLRMESRGTLIQAVGLG